MRIKGRYIGHVCFFDRTCWYHYFKIGSPMAIHIGKRHWRVLNNYKRFERIWDLDNPVAVGEKTRVYGERRKPE